MKNEFIKELEEIKQKIISCQSMQTCPFGKPCKDCANYIVCNMLSVSRRCMTVAIDDMALDS